MGVAGLDARARWRLAIAAILFLAGCATQRAVVPSAPSDAEFPVPIFTAGDALTEKWRHLRVWGETEWRLVALDGEVAIRAVARGTSSALARYVEIDTGICPVAEWSWRVDALSPNADLTSRKTEDVAASLFFVFGDPGTLANPDPVPTIRYVWSADANPPEAVFKSPYFPNSLRNVVVRSGTGDLGAWVTERRDLRADYQRAFGEPPTEPVQVFALFTDNDHLKEPTEAYYRDARVLCTEEPESAGIF